MWRMGMPRVAFGRSSHVRPWLPLYSRFYSKMAAVEPSTADTVCPNLYNLYSVVELYSYTAVIQYTSSTPPLPPSVVIATGVCRVLYSVRSRIGMHRTVSRSGVILRAAVLWAFLARA